MKLKPRPDWREGEADLGGGGGAGGAVERMPEKDDCFWTHPLFLTPLLHIMGAARIVQGPHPLGGQGVRCGWVWFGSAVCTSACKPGLRTRGMVQASVPQFPQAYLLPPPNHHQGLSAWIWEVAPGWHQGGPETGWSAGPQSVAFVLLL